MLQKLLIDKVVLGWGGERDLNNMNSSLES